MFQAYTKKVQPPVIYIEIITGIHIIHITVCDRL